MNNTGIGIIITIIGSAIAIIGVVIAMMFWVRQESNALRAEAKEDRKDLLNLVRAIEIEIKDFHYRLLEIEKSRK
jgi:divalent metal cation (Fe/Co/Zn/Cd) transporter